MSIISTISTLTQFKVGDKVKCKPGFDTKSAGYGYIPNHEFTITNITDNYGNLDRHSKVFNERQKLDDIAWGDKLRGGVYILAIEHIDPLKNLIISLNNELNETR